MYTSVRPFVHLLLAAAFLCMAGLHLPALQLAAWTGMLITYSQDRSLADAAEMTFDGEHPCPMCVAIKKQQAAERDEWTSVPATVKPILFWESSEDPGAPSYRLALLEWHPRLGRARFLPPELPPPLAT